MKGKANAVAQWFREHPRLGVVIRTIPLLLGMRYLGEVIAAFVSGRPLDFGAAWSGESLDSGVTWAAMIIAGLVIVVFFLLVRYLFRRYIGKP